MSKIIEFPSRREIDGRMHEARCSGFCFGLMYNCGLTTDCTFTPHDSVPHDCWVKSLRRAEMLFYITVVIAIVVAIIGNMTGAF